MNKLISLVVALAACGVEREDSETTAPVATSGDTGPSFGQAGGNDGGGLTPTTPDPTITGTAAEDPTEPDPTVTVEDTGAIVDDSEPVGCQSTERLVTVFWNAYSAEPISEISISGMLEATYGGYGYVINMQTGSPVGMTVESSTDDIAAGYDVCVPIGSRFEWSVSYRDAAGDMRYSCEGEDLVENGEFEVIVDDMNDDPFDDPPAAWPTPVLNGSGGCEHEFWL